MDVGRAVAQRVERGLDYQILELVDGRTIPGGYDYWKRWFCEDYYARLIPAIAEGASEDAE